MKKGQILTYLESADVAKVLGVTPTRVRQLAAEGAIPASARTLSGTRLFSSEIAEQVRLRRLAEAPQEQE